MIALLAGLAGIIHGQIFRNTDNTKPQGQYELWEWIIECKYNIHGDGIVLLLNGELTTVGVATIVLRIVADYIEWIKLIL